MPHINYKEGYGNPKTRRIGPLKITKRRWEDLSSSTQFELAGRALEILRGERGRLEGIKFGKVPKTWFGSGYYRGDNKSTYDRENQSQKRR